jgi:hypothetical protein
MADFVMLNKARYLAVNQRVVSENPDFSELRSVSSQNIHFA